jgi:hypothetical protein
VPGERGQLNPGGRLLLVDEGGPLSSGCVEQSVRAIEGCLLPLCTQ